MNSLDRPAGQSAARFLLPYPAADVRGLPDDLPVGVWDGTDSPPDAENLATVEFLMEYKESG